jgi:hypothetical protein
MTPSMHIITLALAVSAEDHAAVTEFAEYLRQQGHPMTPNAITYTYTQLLALAIAALKRSDEDDAAACTVAA